jgi:tetratricopeptide (TPR) repeat protein
MKSFYNLKSRKTHNRYFGIIIVLLFTSAVLFAQNIQQRLRTADALVANHQYERALGLYEQIYNTNKQNLSAIIGIKKCYIGLQEYERLILFLEETLKFQSGRSPLYIDLGEAYFLNDNRDKALSVWSSHLERNKKDVGVYRLLAMAMIRQRLYDEAIEVYLKAINRLKNQETMHVDIANLHKALLNYEKASEHYLYYYLSKPKQFAYLQRQLLALSDKGEDITPVVTAINSFLVTHPDQNKVREILAGLYLKGKQFDRAFEIYKSLETENSNGIYIQKFAREAYANEAYRYAIAGYEHLIQTYKNSPLIPQAYSDLGQSYSGLAYTLEDEEGSGKTMAKAVQIFTEIIKSNKSSGFVATSYIRLAEIYKKYYFDLDKAIINYQSFLKRNSDKKVQSGVLLQLGDTYLTKGQMNDALRTYQLATHKEYQNIAEFKSAEVHFYNTQFKKAEESYSSLLSQLKPNDTLMNNILARTMLIKSSQADSLSLSRYARADYMKFQKKYSQAAEEFEELSKSKNSLQVQAGIQAGHLYNYLGKYEDSKRVLLPLKQDIPEDKDMDEVIFLLAESEEELNNLVVALDLYHQFLAQYPNSLLIHKAREKARFLSIELKKDQS